MFLVLFSALYPVQVGDQSGGVQAEEGTVEGIEMYWEHCLFFKLHLFFCCC